MYLIKHHSKYCYVRKEVPEEAEPDDILVIPPVYHHLFVDPGAEDITIEDNNVYNRNHGKTVSVELVPGLVHHDHYLNLARNVELYTTVISAMREIFGHETFFMYGQILCACTVNVSPVNGEYIGRRMDNPRIYRLGMDPWFHFIMSPRESRTAVEIFDELYDVHIRQVLEDLDQRDRDFARFHVLFPEEQGKGTKFLEPYYSDCAPHMGVDKSIQVVEEATGTKRVRVFPEGRGYMTKSNPVNYLYARPDFAVNMTADAHQGGYVNSTGRKIAACFLTGYAVPAKELDVTWKRSRSRISRALVGRNPSKSQRMRPNEYAARASTFHNLIRGENFVYFQVNSNYCGSNCAAVLSLRRGVKVNKAPTGYLPKGSAFTYLTSIILPGMRAASVGLKATVKELEDEHVLEKFYGAADVTQQRHPNVILHADFRYWLLNAGRDKVLFKMFEPEFIPVREQKCEKVKKCIGKCRKAYAEMISAAADLLAYWLEFLLERYPGDDKVALQRTDDVWNQIFFHYYSEEGESDCTKIFNKLSPEYQSLLMSRAERHKEKSSGTECALKFLKQQKEEEECRICNSRTGGKA